jgi:hypothetical protein
MGNEKKERGREREVGNSGRRGTVWKIKADWGRGGGRKQEKEGDCTENEKEKEGKQLGKQEEKRRWETIEEEGPCGK